eukprot:11628032-Alexandrium_andersonii.AAC.1
MKDLITQAQVEFQAPAQSVALLRGQAQLEITALKEVVGATRPSLEGSPSVFSRAANRRGKTGRGD